MRIAKLVKSRAGQGKESVTWISLKSANGVVLMRSNPHRSEYMTDHRRRSIKRAMRQIAAGEKR